MIGRILLAIISVLAAPLSAQAAWDAGAGAEDYQWIEYPAGFSGNPKEDGGRSALFVYWEQEGERGPLMAWRVKLYGGTVSYDTYVISTGAPVSTKTDYGGIASEEQMFYRYNLGTYKLDQVAGFGLDAWRRHIRNSGGDQIEDYSILFLRAGLRLAKSRREEGFHGECGIKFPVATKEDAHLTSTYSPGGHLYNTNPEISPKGAVSRYAEFGYRINTRFDLVGYYDSWRFKRSEDVMTTDTAGAGWLIHQPQSNMDALGFKLLVSF